MFSNLFGKKCKKGSKNDFQGYRLTLTVFSQIVFNLACTLISQYSRCVFVFVEICSFCKITAKFNFLQKMSKFYRKWLNIDFSVNTKQQIVYYCIICIFRTYFEKNLILQIFCLFCLFCIYRLDKIIWTLEAVWYRYADSNANMNLKTGDGWENLIPNN